LPEHGCGAVEIPGGAGVIAEAVGLVAPGPRVGRSGGLQIHYPLAMRGQVIGSRLTRDAGPGITPGQGDFGVTTTKGLRGDRMGADRAGNRLHDVELVGQQWHLALHPGSIAGVSRPRGAVIAGLDYDESVGPVPWPQPRQMR